MPDDTPDTPNTPAASPARAPAPRTRHVVCPAADLPPGERRIVDIGNKSIGVFNIDGEYLAIGNACPHQRAPLCKGTLAQTADADHPDEWRWREGSCVIRCPWHGWEFDLRTGRSVFNPHRVGVRTFDVVVESGEAACVSASDPDPEVPTYRTGVENSLVVLYI